MTKQTPVTITRLQAMKEGGEKITMLTAYDAGFARVMDEAGVDIILIGDSLGMVVQGKQTTVGVSVADIAYHTRCVAAGARRAFLLADMPFGSYHDNATAMKNAVDLLSAGGMMVKLEGAGPMIAITEYLTSRGVPVCAHLGLTPQSANQLGGFKVQARESAEADRLVDDALAMQQAGAQLLVLECVPSSVGQRVAESLDLPVIGIGAGRHCDGQVLVMHDMLGLSDRVPKFVANFMQGAGTVGKAFEQFVQAVRGGEFPAEEHEY